jgi:antitoxin component YwqK of YwqJK toxin-antitoxin module/predicted DCC family thiol-disulfide oxidoreductase YuxK
VLAHLRDFYFTIDCRSLGAFRICLGSCLIAEWVIRWRWFSVLYAADGVLPAATLREVRPFSYFATPLVLLDGWPWAARAFFALALVCYVMLLLGYRTRLATALSLLAFASLAHRNPYVLIGADFVFGSMLLWGLFLPLGSRFSIDAVRAALRGGVPLAGNSGIQPPGAAPQEASMAAPPRAPTGPRIAGPRRSGLSIAALGIVLQIGLIYLATACWKYGPTWWSEGTAVYYVLHMQQHLWPLGEWVRTWPLEALQFLTWAALAIEYAALPMILWPARSPWLRRVIVLLLVGLHAGIALVLDAGMFSFAMLATFPLLMTDADWQFLRRWLHRCTRPATAYYDDSCGICTRTCEIVAVLDRFSRITFVGSSDLDRRRHEIPAGLTDKTIVVFDDRTGRMATRAAGTAMLLRGLPLPWRLLACLGWPGVRSVSNVVYDLVAANRHHLSRWLGLAACGVPRARAASAGAPRFSEPAAAPPLPWAAWVQSGLAGLVLIAVLKACVEENLSRTDDPPGRRGDPLSLLIRYPPAIQRWNMFSPDAPRFDAWWVVAARTDRGRQIDPLTGQPPTFEQPPRTPRRFGSTWGVYLKHSISQTPGDKQPEADRLRIALAKYLAEQCERTSGQKLVSLELYRVRRMTADPLRVPAVWGLDKLLLCSYFPAEGRFVRGPQRSELRREWGSGAVESVGGFEVSTDLADGPWTFFHEHGPKKWTGQFRCGVRQGLWEAWRPDGTLELTGRYENDRRAGVWTGYYRSGKRQWQVTYQYGVCQGPAMSWYESGRVQQQGSYINDQREGPWTQWHPNGRRAAQGSYQAGRQHGRWTYWHPNGQLDRTVDYRAGNEAPAGAAERQYRPSAESSPQDANRGRVLARHVNAAGRPRSGSAPLGETA